jgi:hypothetical protein
MVGGRLSCVRRAPSRVCCCVLAGISCDCFAAHPAAAPRTAAAPVGGPAAGRTAEVPTVYHGVASASAPASESQAMKRQRGRLPRWRCSRATAARFHPPRPHAPCVAVARCAALRGSVPRSAPLPPPPFLACVCTMLHVQARQRGLPPRHPLQDLLRTQPRPWWLPPSRPTLPRWGVVAALPLLPPPPHRLHPVRCPCRTASPTPYSKGWLAGCVWRVKVGGVDVEGSDGEMGLVLALGGVWGAGGTLSAAVSALRCLLLLCARSAQAPWTSMSF